MASKHQWCKCTDFANLGEAIDFVSARMKARSTDGGPSKSTAWAAVEEKQDEEVFVAMNKSFVPVWPATSPWENKAAMSEWHDAMRPLCNALNIPHKYLISEANLASAWDRDGFGDYGRPGRYLYMFSHLVRHARCCAQWRHFCKELVVETRVLPPVLCDTVFEYAVADGKSILECLFARHDLCMPPSRPHYKEATIASLFNCLVAPACRNCTAVFVANCNNMVDFTSDKS